MLLLILETCLSSKDLAGLHGLIRASDDDLTKTNRSNNKLMLDDRHLHIIISFYMRVRMLSLIGEEYNI